MISILCSNYNSSKWIDNYLKYLDKQLLQNFEVIFVDACSTDDSLQKISKFKFRKGISKIIIQCETRIGIYEAWNMAIKQSSYDYVMNYNTDDKLFSNALITLASYISLYPHIDVIYSNCAISKDKDHQQLTGWYLWADANNIQHLINGCCVGPFPLLRRSSVIKAGLFDPTFSISGDYEMWCRMNRKGYKFIKLDEFLGVYYQNPEGISTRPDPIRHGEHVRQDTIIRQRYS